MCPGAEQHSIELIEQHSIEMLAFIKLLLGSWPSGDDGMCLLSHWGRPRHHKIFAAAPT